MGTACRAETPAAGWDAASARTEAAAGEASARMGAPHDTAPATPAASIMNLLPRHADEHALKFMIDAKRGLG